MERLAMDAWFNSTFGFSDDVLLRVGKLMLGWALFEHHLETQLFQVVGFPVPGEKAKLEGAPISLQLNKLGEEGERQIGVNRDQLALFVAAATNLLAYRNAIAHGVPVPGSTLHDLPPTSVSNMPWYGIPRRRSRASAGITIEELDDALWVLDQLMLALGRADAMSAVAEKLGAVVQQSTLERAAETARRLARGGRLGALLATQHWD